MCSSLKNIQLLVLKNGDEFYDHSIFTNEHHHIDETNLLINNISLMTFEETLMYWFGIMISLVLNYYIIIEIYNSVNI